MMKDNDKKAGIGVRLSMWFAGTFIFRKRKVVRQTNIDDKEPAIYICNHSGARGPMNMALYFDKPACPWVTNCVFDKVVGPNYVFHDVLRGRQFKIKFFFRWLSHFLAFFLRHLLTAQGSIKVYRNDARILNTYKETIEVLKKNFNIVIFPESPVRYNKYINNFYDGIADLGFFVWKVMHKKLKFYPTYIPNQLKTINVGEPIEFNPENSIEDERKRLISILQNSFEIIGDSLPEHKVINFLPKSYYKYYNEFQYDSKAFWKFVDQKRSE